MEFDLSADQHQLLTSFEALLKRFATTPTTAHDYVAYSAELQAELADSGFLEVASQPGYGLLEAALLVEAAASCPVGVEVASALISPLVSQVKPPLALAWGLNKPARYLPLANTVCLLHKDGVIVGTPAEADWQPIKSVMAYPLAVLKAVPKDGVHYTGDAALAVKRRALIGIAAEAAGLMRGSLNQTVQYVKDRRQFGQPLAQFQAIQHRLAENAQLVHACRTLALRAAYADDEQSAAVACLYAQEAMRKLIYDCHQFSGAMGLTLEYPLHLWTYRLKVLQGEAGGRAEQARLVADCVWGRANASAPLRKAEKDHHVHSWGARVVRND